MKKYLDKDVLTSSQERIAWIFDNYDNVQVSISGGKDSTVLFYLALNEAKKRDREIEVFFLDQEAEYEATIDIIKEQMSFDNVIPLWYQVPIYMTNSTSYNDYFLHAWGSGDKWIREKDNMSIKEIAEEYPQRFYDFFNWIENKDISKAYLVGIRADESLDRFRATTKREGADGIKWSTKRKSGAITFYPLYDWHTKDIWKYIYDNNIRYNRIYDKMYYANLPFNEMRVSTMIHEKSYKSLQDIGKFEPATYNKLCVRIKGISTASLYSKEKQIYSNKKLPSHFANWKEYRDFLVENLPFQKAKDRFINRFANQPKNEVIYKEQVGQLLINDYENFRSIDIKKHEKKQAIKNKWKDLL